MKQKLTSNKIVDVEEAKEYFLMHIDSDFQDSDEIGITASRGIWILNSRNKHFLVVPITV